MLGIMGRAYSGGQRGGKKGEVASQMDGRATNSQDAGATTWQKRAEMSGGITIAICSGIGNKMRGSPVYLG